jgi:hypothetical protein
LKCRQNIILFIKLKLARKIENHENQIKSSQILIIMLISSLALLSISSCSKTVILDLWKNKFQLLLLFFRKNCLETTTTATTEEKKNYYVFEEFRIILLCPEGWRLRLWRQAGCSKNPDGTIIN